MYRFLFLYRLDMSIQAEQCVGFSTTAIFVLSESQIIADSRITRIEKSALSDSSV